jgi:hypothetical protein
MNRGSLLVPFIFGLLLFYFVDSQVFQSLYERLTFPKIYEYAHEVSAVASFVSLQKLLAVAGILILMWFFRRISLNFSNKAGFIILTCAVTGAIMPYVNLSGRPFDLFFDGATANVLRINQRLVLDQSVKIDVLLKARRTFPDLTEKFDEFYSGKLDLDCDKKGKEISASRTNAKNNVIIIISESLSQVDSLRSGGVFNRLPRIDNKMQAEGLTLTNVISDGSGTADAMASIFLGIEPLPTTYLKNDLIKRFPTVCREYNSLKELSGQENICERNLVCRAKNNGYKTYFITNSPLDFGDADPWFKKLGFDYIEGNESEFFRNYPKYTFNSPPDDILYNRAYEVISKESEPYLLVLLTVGLHLPYSLPYDKDRISNDAKLNQLNYVDRTTVDFYDELKNTGFFNNGILLLVGDHRRMAPFEPEEIQRRGIDSNGRVIASFIGKGFRKGIIDNTPLNQSDLSTILSQIVNGVPPVIDNLSCYNKGHLLGINEPFTMNIIAKDYIYILIRRQGNPPNLIYFKRDLDLLSFSDLTDQKIFAYILMSKGWLFDRQRECSGQ